MKKFFLKFPTDFTFNKYSLINSFKAVFACILGLYLANYLHLAQPQWVLISIVIVMASQYRLGGALKKGYARLFATAIGSGIAAAILFLFSAHIAVIYTVLFIFIMLFIYLANNSKDYSYSYTLGAVTMIIIVVSSNPQLQSAINRLIEIMLGVIIAILTSRFIFPIHAERLLYRNISETLQLLKTVYQLFIREDKTFTLKVRGKNLEEEVINKFAQQVVLLNEACTETYKIRKRYTDFVIFLRLERRLLRSVYMLHYTLRVSLKSFSNIINMQEFKIIHHEIIRTIDNLAHHIRNKTVAIENNQLDKTYKEVVEKLRPMFNEYSFEEKNKIHAFIFCLGHVIFVLNRMQREMVDLR